MKKLLGILGLLVVLILAGFAIPTGTAIQFDKVKAGPYVDSVVYKIITQSDQQVLALQADNVELIANTISPAVVDVLESDPDIEVANHTRNGYGKFVIKCDKYPLNITAFRRAFAFALNKTNVSLTLLDGNANPIDSPLPEANPWSIEGALPYSYYDQNIIIANQTLEDAGFTNIDGDGWREAPDGSDFSVDIEVASSSSLSIDIGNMAASALQAIGVDATCVPTNFNDYLTRVNLHGDFDVVFFTQDFADYDPTWMVHEFGSDFYDVYNSNPSNFQNATFDAWADQLLNDPTYAGVLEAVTNMQEIIVHSSPEIMIYSNTYFTSYRSDQFEGQVNDQAKGTFSTWTNIKTHLLPTEGGPFGGLFDIALPSDMDSFNFMVSSSASTMTVLDNLYMSLFKNGPNGELIPYLAKNFTIETHSDNPAIAVNHTRFTIDILQNATWSDFTPLTASDVAFTFDFYKNSTAFGNPMGLDLSELVTAYASSTYQVVLEFSTESYWQFDKFAYDYILPEYAFTQAYIGPPAWDLWDPVFTTDPHVTCGPFILSDYQSGEYIELTANPFYPYRLAIPPSVSGPDDFSAVENSWNVIRWNASDDNPVVYFVLENGTQMVGDFWFGGDIYYEFYAPSPGWVMNLTCIVWDGDAQYAIDTVLVTGLQDNLPPIFTSEPSDLEYNVGDTGNFLSWTFFDHTLASVNLYLDDVIIYFDDMMDPNVTILEWDVDGLTAGTYNYTLYLDDIWMNSATSTVIVTVVDDSPPSIDSPLFVFLLAGESTNNVTWTATDSDPTSYTVYQNGSVIETGTWTSGEPIVVDLSSLEWGVYNLTIVVTDAEGHVASDTVMVFVLPSTSGIQFTLDQIMLLSIGIVGVGVVIIVIVVKLKRPS